MRSFLNSLHPRPDPGGARGAMAPPQLKKSEDYPANFQVAPPPIEMSSDGYLCIFLSNFDKIMLLFNENFHKRKISWTIIRSLFKSLSFYLIHLSERLWPLSPWVSLLVLGHSWPPPNEIFWIRPSLIVKSAEIRGSEELSHAWIWMLNHIFFK